jgi:large subunit ribosomal protein L18
MAIMISHRHMYAQFVDDDRGMTLASASTLLGGGGGNNAAVAQQLGERAAEAARGCGITRAVVDRGGYRYHGRVKAIVEAVRRGGVNCGLAPAGEEAAENAAKKPDRDASRGRGKKEEK